MLSYSHEKNGKHYILASDLKNGTEFILEINLSSFKKEFIQYFCERLNEDGVHCLIPRRGPKRYLSFSEQKQDSIIFYSPRSLKPKNQVYSSNYAFHPTKGALPLAILFNCRSMFLTFMSRLGYSIDLGRFNFNLNKINLQDSTAQENSLITPHPASKGSVEERTVSSIFNKLKIG